MNQKGRNTFAIFPPGGAELRIVRKSKRGRYLEKYKDFI